MESRRVLFRSSFGPGPALSKAARAASIVGVSPLSTEREGENTSKLFSGLVFTAADLNLTCVRPNSRAFFSEARISATPPSEGLQNIYCVRGSLIMREARIAPWSIAARRQAWGVREPFSNALDATRASVRAEIP